MTPNQALELPFYCRDLDEKMTIREYMRRLLSTLFEEGESFSGKRPFGNSGWSHDLILPLVVSGAVAGSYTAYDEDGEETTYDADDAEQEVEGYIDDHAEYNTFVQSMIAAL